MDIKDKAALVVEVTEAIVPILRGIPPDIQGAVIAHLFARYLVSAYTGPDREERRKEILQSWVGFVTDMVSLAERTVAT